MLLGKSSSIINFRYIYTGEAVMMKNIQNLAREKSRENRPRRKGLHKMGAQNVGIRKSTVDSYAA